jgi:subtilisin family serine protease
MDPINAMNPITDKKSILNMRLFSIATEISMPGGRANGRHFFGLAGFLKHWRLIWLLGGLLLTAAAVMGQHPNWQNQDLQKDTVFGISTEKAYNLLKGKRHSPVIVAVIDGGTDTAHEDLRDVLWVNATEKPGNGIDDDHDGYVDDVHGWDFIGGKDSDVHYDNLELTRLLRDEGPHFDTMTASSVAPKDTAAFAGYQRMKAEYDKAHQHVEDIVVGIGRFKTIMNAMQAKMGKDSPALADWEAYAPEDPGQQRVREILLGQLKIGGSFGQLVREGIEEPEKHFTEELKYHYNLDYDPRYIVGDDYNNSNQRDYGNADVTGPDALHGTHVAGIIGAARGNGKGIDGVADDVRLMIIRVVPDGDERDKDIANGIRFAADHGAKVINMSFGKGYSKDKAAVDAAAKYALSKDVLLVEASGNSGMDLDDPANHNFPSRVYEDGTGVAGAWIVVGASGRNDDSNLVAGFSNYGKTTVDVFAPGVDIYSCLPGSKYGEESGTSMASPVVAGLAALLREYYPKLNASQVKDIILRSVVKPAHPVWVGGGEHKRLVTLDEISVTGGVVNAYRALELASKQ